jgi:RNA polymerase sigma-70 factor (ECF subfamily)
MSRWSVLVPSCHQSYVKTDCRGTPPEHRLEIAHPMTYRSESHTTRVQQLFVRHQSKVRSVALALTGDFAAAEDVVQETFLTVTAKAGEFEPDTNFLAWACAIARLKVLERRRRDRRLSPKVIESLAAALPQAELAEERLMPLLDCIDQLSPKALELVRMRYFSEHGPGEIAELLGRSVAGVNAALVKIRESLRECVGKKLVSEA